MPSSHPSHPAAWRRLHEIGFVALLAVVALGCRPHSSSRSLWPADAAPQVLVERSRIALPPTPDANRFLAGWWPWRFEGRIALGAASEGARLQWVNLAARPRTLHLDLVEAPAPGSRVRVVAAGRELGSFPLTDPLAVPLPGDLGLGRILVELYPSGAPLDVLGAALRPALPAGEALWEGPDLVQTGPSRVELTADLSAVRELRGSLDPRGSEAGGGTAAGASASLRLLDAGHRVLARFDWTADDGPGRRRFRLDLAQTEGPARVILEVLGDGGPVRWRDLRWIDEPAAAPTAQPAHSADSRQDTAAGPPRLVVLYVMDALRADFVGHLGDSDPAGAAAASTTFDRLAGEGVAFRRHRSLAPSTLPSSTVLLTGVLPPSPPANHPPLAELFRHAGYRTGLFSANPYVSHAYALDRGFDHVATEVLYSADDEQPGHGPGYNDSAERVHAAALAWLDTLPPGERAFLYVHTLHPHNPYTPPPELEERFTAGIESAVDGSTDTLIAIEREERPASVADQARLRALYAANLAYNDRELGRFLDALRARYDDSSLFLALTSDHGEELFDHGGVLHGYTLYEELLRIPLVLWAPGRLRPAVVDAVTDTLDLHVTLAHLADQRQPAAAAPGGGRMLLDRSFRLTPPPADRLHFAAAPTVRGGLFAVQDGRHKLVLTRAQAPAWGMGLGPGRSHDPAYLFDLDADPGERRNLLGRGGLTEQRLRARLRAWIDSRRRTGGGEPAAEVDEETRRRLQALGYLR